MQVIPLIDITKGSSIDLLKQYSDKAINLVEASKNTFGLASRLSSVALLPMGDFLSRRWLQKNNNPYLAEIDQYKKHLNIKGVYALNMCYEWGCTSGIYTDNNNKISFIRVLDWPFPALGENIVIAHQAGSAGDFYNITWPGVSGIFQAFAPGRFAAALNQAPMRRHKTGIILDWFRNRHAVHKKNALPPAHLLRKVFETAGSYEEAKHLLMHEPISIPVIFTLAGMNCHQGCVIERLENYAYIREIKDGYVSAANHFESELNAIGYGWLPRAVDSYGRSKMAKKLKCDGLQQCSFDWFKYPIANSFSRVVLQVETQTGKFSLMGTDGLKPVTEVFSL